MDDPVAVGLRLKEARERAGLSQRRLAFDGCSPAYISRVEAGTRIPSPAVIADLAARLGVSDSWLATGKENRGAALLRDAEIALRLDDTDEARRLYSNALDEAVDAAGRSRALEGLADIALRTGNPRRAISLAEEALAETDDRPEERPSLAEGLARAHAANGELAPAIAVLERCVERFANDPVQFVRFSVLLGAALTDGGDFAQAERVIGGALARGREIADPYTRARLYWSESRLLQEQGSHEAAEGYARKTLETLRATEDEYAIAHVLQMLAHITLDLGRPGEALELLREGRAKIDAVGTPLEVAQYRIEEARALAALGEHGEAAALAMELTQAARRPPSARLRARVPRARAEPERVRRPCAGGGDLRARDRATREPAGLAARRHRVQGAGRAAQGAGRARAGARGSRAGASRARAGRAPARLTPCVRSGIRSRGLPIARGQTPLRTTREIRPGRAWYRSPVYRLGVHLRLALAALVLIAVLAAGSTTVVSAGGARAPRLRASCSTGPRSGRSSR